MRRFLDLSVAIDNDTPADPPPLRPKILYQDHAQSVAEVLSFFPGLRQDQLPDGAGWAVESLQVTAHNGTHLDAPWHYHPTMDDGARAITIDEVPLDWCYRPGVKLDFRHMEDGYVASAADIEAELRRIEVGS